LLRTAAGRPGTRRVLPRRGRSPAPRVPGDGPGRGARRPRALPGTGPGRSPPPPGHQRRPFRPHRRPPGRRPGRAGRSPPPGRPDHPDRGRAPAGHRDRRRLTAPDERCRRLSARRRAALLAAVTVTLPRWPIVGRRVELEVFGQALDSGEHTGLLIYGRAGVGKTRLADECRQQAAVAGHPTERIVGSRTTALLPLGAVAV